MATGNGCAACRFRKPEAPLDPSAFMRVHRTYLVGLRHVNLLRKEGDGAVVELDGTNPHLVPVSRSKMAEVKARLGVSKKPASVNRSRLLTQFVRRMPHFVR